jgi:hypothetical protein
VSGHHQSTFKDGHLPFPREFRKENLRQKRLNAFFRRQDGRSAIDRLLELNDKFGIGGAPPYVAARAARKDAAEVFVIRHTETGDQRTTGVLAHGMTVTQALALEPVKAALEAFADEKLFAYQAEHAPATLLYSTVIRRFLIEINPNFGGSEKSMRTKSLEKDRNIPDADARFRADASRAEQLITEFLHERTLESHRSNLPTEIKNWLIRRAREAGAQQDVAGQYAGAANATVAVYIALVRRALSWLATTYRPLVSLYMESLKLPSQLSEPLMWADARLIVLWSRGFVWEDGGFAREWVWREGDWHLVWKRRDDAFRAKYKPLLRHVLCYATVGARLRVALHMGWAPHDYRGMINFDAGEFVRAGPLAPQPSNKPRGATVMLPFVKRMFAVWLAADRRMNDTGKCASTDHSYVIHDGRGGAVWHVTKLMAQACEALERNSSSHKLKTANVTQLYLAGFDIQEIASIVGNVPQSLMKYYLRLQRHHAGVERPRPNRETMTFIDLVNPLGRLPPIPRAPIPPRPSLPPQDG